MTRNCSCPHVVLFLNIITHVQTSIHAETVLRMRLSQIIYKAEELCIRTVVRTNGHLGSEMMDP